MIFHEDGIEIQRRFVSCSVLNTIKNEVDSSTVAYSTHGIRGANKKFKSISMLANSEVFINLASSLLGGNPEIVRVIYFDKTPDKNWFVSWHQDKTIALNKKVEIEGWGVWSIKDNTHCVQPPVEVLNNMVTFRLHLDDADKNNGCLNVIPQSHKSGILSHTELIKMVNSHNAYSCEGEAGDLVIMKPHIIHSSSKSLNPKHRRVIHIEYSNYALPSGLSWL